LYCHTWFLESPLHRRTLGARCATAKRRAMVRRRLTSWWRAIRRGKVAVSCCHRRVCRGMKQEAKAPARPLVSPRAATDLLAGLSSPLPADPRAPPPVVLRACPRRKHKHHWTGYGFVIPPSTEGPEKLRLLAEADALPHDPRLCQGKLTRVTADVRYANSSGYRELFCTMITP